MDQELSILAADRENLHHPTRTLQEESYLAFLHNTDQSCVDASAFWQPAKVALQQFYPALYIIRVILHCW